ncbi:hypothetical protein CYMTET_47562 [Cymbomonas tetramitiformis]|uniref:Uncharacterized protein n=1 Tax=Cymbomonas tetramitiformis TaxID=36881 RepID=A0AAE0BTZ2_9CHLO|nr:hypothetical protein CYMTET_47562 [Cymbomonas tetramitiformis]
MCCPTSSELQPMAACCPTSSSAKLPQRPTAQAGGCPSSSSAELPQRPTAACCPTSSELQPTATRCPTSSELQSTAAYCPTSSELQLTARARSCPNKAAHLASSAIAALVTHAPSVTAVSAIHKPNGQATEAQPLQPVCMDQTQPPQPGKEHIGCTAELAAARDPYYTLMTIRPAPWPNDQASEECGGMQLVGAQRDEPKE